MNISEIEDALRAAPDPKPPAGLRERLIAEVRLPVRGVTGTHGSGVGGWVRRWWPVFGPGAVSLACAVGLTVQQVEMRELKENIRSTTQEAATRANASTAPADSAAASSIAARTEQEIARLKDLAARLTTEIAELERLRADNAKLRTQLAAPAAGSLTAEEADALAKAKEKAEAIACINNLKQLGLAVRVWALDNTNMTPPEVLEMTNEMATPKILYCPSDKGRQMAETFASYTAANCSYEYLAPAALEADSEPMRVLFRCPIHGHVTLCDGSVQGYVGKRHPEQLIEREGKLYFVPSINAPGGSPPASSQP